MKLVELVSSDQPDLEARGTSTKIDQLNKLTDILRKMIIVVILWSITCLVREHVFQRENFDTSKSFVWKHKNSKLTF